MVPYSAPLPGGPRRVGPHQNPERTADLTAATKTNMRVIFALTLVHFTGDFYSAFTTPLFPYLWKN
jgi:hypothetical protein